MVTLPITAYAQSQKIISDAIVQATIKEFKPTFCRNSWKGVANAMADCYDKTNTKDPKIHQCISADMATQETVTKLDKKIELLANIVLLYNMMLHF